MIRRQMLTTLAASAFLPVVVTLSPAEAAIGPIGDHELNHAEMTRRVGAFSLAISRLALDAATASRIKRFARFEVAEQETMADVLQSMKIVQGEGRVPSDAELEAMLDQEGKRTLALLKGLSGAGFDKAYIAAQRDGHKTLLAVQERYLTVGRNREHMSLAKLARGVVSEHMEQLKIIRI